MKQTMKLIPAAILALSAGSAVASAFQLLEQNASGLGNAYAGSAAVADNASTIFFNPAGMTQLQPREISAGLTGVLTSYKFTNSGSSTGALTGNGGDPGGLGLIPNGYLSWALNKDLYVGVGFGAPFGLKTDYDNPWLGGAQAIKFDIKTYNINPSIAYRVNNMVSLGFGVDWQRMEAEYVRIAGVNPAPIAGVVPVPLTSTTVQLKADDDSWGWNAGVLLNLSPSTKVGVSYRSSVKHKLDGSLTASGPAALAAFHVSQSGPATADIELPETFIVSATQAINSQWEMLGDISWTGWSRYRQGRCGQGQRYRCPNPRHQVPRHLAGSPGRQLQAVRLFEAEVRHRLRPDADPRPGASSGFAAGQQPRLAVHRRAMEAEQGFGARLGHYLPVREGSGHQQQPVRQSARPGQGFLLGHRLDLRRAVLDELLNCHPWPGARRASHRRRAKGC